MPTKIIRKQHILRPAKKIGVFVLLLIQLARIAGIFGSMFIIYNSLITEQTSMVAFDDIDICCGYCNCNLDAPNSVTLVQPTAKRNITRVTAKGVKMCKLCDCSDLERGSSDKGVHCPEITIKDYLLLTLPCIEVLMCLSITYTVIGPLSPKVSIRRWIIWLFRMRIFWMRSVWTCTAVVYTILYAKFRDLKYAQGNFEYHDSNLAYAALAATAVEYGCLGMLECVVHVVKVETIESRLIKHDRGMRGFWRKLYMICYYFCLFAFALRSFSLSLYFGILSALASVDGSDDLVGESRILHALVQVLRIFLAIIRGKFYGLFMKNLLSHFFYETDDQYYQRDLKVGKLTEEELDNNQVEEKEGEWEGVLMVERNGRTWKEAQV